MSTLPMCEWISATRENVKKIEIGQPVVFKGCVHKFVVWTDEDASDDFQGFVDTAIGFPKEWIDGVEWFMLLPPTPKTKAEILAEKINLLFAEKSIVTMSDIVEIIESVYGKER